MVVKELILASQQCENITRSCSFFFCCINEIERDCFNPSEPSLALVFLCSFISFLSCFVTSGPGKKSYIAFSQQCGY